MFIRGGKRVCGACAHRTTGNRTVLNSHTFDKGSETYKTTVITETIDVDLAAIMDSGALTKKNLICQNCGMDYGTVDQTGKVGCSDCFVGFRAHLMTILRKIDKRVKLNDEGFR